MFNYNCYKVSFRVGELKILLGTVPTSHVSFLFILLVKSNVDQFTTRRGENKSRFLAFPFCAMSCLFSWREFLRHQRTYSTIFDQIRLRAFHLKVF